MKRWAIIVCGAVVIGTPFLVWMLVLQPKDDLAAGSEDVSGTGSGTPGSVQDAPTDPVPDPEFRLLLARYFELRHQEWDPEWPTRVEAARRDALCRPAPESQILLAIREWQDGIETWWLFELLAEVASRRSTAALVECALGDGKFGPWRNARLQCLETLLRLDVDTGLRIARGLAFDGRLPDYDQVALGTIYRIGEVRVAEALPLLITIVESGLSSRYRERAIEAVARLGSRESADYIVSYIRARDFDSWSHHLLCWTAEALPPDERMRFLSIVRAEPDPILRSHMLTAIGHAVDTSVDLMEMLATATDPAVRASLAGTLARGADRTGREAALGILENPSEEYGARLAVAEALLETGLTPEELSRLSGLVLQGTDDALMLRLGAAVAGMTPEQWDDPDLISRLRSLALTALSRGQFDDMPFVDSLIVGLDRAGVRLTADILMRIEERRAEPMPSDSRLVAGLVHYVGDAEVRSHVLAIAESEDVLPDWREEAVGVLMSDAAFPHVREDVLRIYSRESDERVSYSLLMSAIDRGDVGFLESIQSLAEGSDAPFRRNELEIIRQVLPALRASRGFDR